MIHSIFDSILLYPRFNSKYYSIQKKSADSIQKIIQLICQGIIDTGWMGQVPKNYLKNVQNRLKQFSIYTFDNLKSKSMVRLVRAEKIVLSGLVFARKIARMILIQNIQGLMDPLMINMAFMPLYMWEMWDVTPVTDEHTDTRTVESRAVFSLSWIRNKV